MYAFVTWLVLPHGDVRDPVSRQRQGPAWRSRARAGDARRRARRGARRARGRPPGRPGRRTRGGTRGDPRPRHDRQQRSAVRDGRRAGAADSRRSGDRGRRRRDDERPRAPRRARFRAALRRRKRVAIRGATRRAATRPARLARRRRHVGRPRARARTRRREHPRLPPVKVAVLSGGVGGARFLLGLVDAGDPAGVTAIVNVGDDLEVLGLAVSPDLDSVVYALADLADEERGWERADETWNALATVEGLGGDAWFRLGDRDLGLHLVRTQALRTGQPLSAVTAQLTAALGLETTILPATDDRLRTWLDTPNGSFDFQHWFVARAHRDPVDRVRFENASDARPAPGGLEGLPDADSILIAPSNPYVSIGPILAVERIRSALGRRRVPCVAVSPLIGGEAVKGPAGAMLQRLEGGTTPAHVAQCYAGLIDALVVDEADAHQIDTLGVRPIVAKTLMRDAASRRALAEAALDAVALA